MRKPLPQAPPAAPGSLAEALALVPAPRHPYGWRPEYPPIPLVALLQLAVAATFAGRAACMPLPNGDGSGWKMIRNCYRA